MDDLLIKVGKELDKLPQNEVLTTKMLKALINKVSEEEVKSILSQVEFTQEELFTQEF